MYKKDSSFWIEHSLSVSVPCVKSGNCCASASLVKLHSTQVWLRLWLGLKGNYSGFPGDAMVKNLPVNAGDTSSTPGSEDPPEEEMTTHLSIIAWKIP